MKPVLAEHVGVEAGHRVLKDWRGFEIVPLK
jgi:hypothetical protein